MRHHGNIATTLEERDLHGHPAVDGIEDVMEVTYREHQPESQQDPKATEEMRMLCRRE